MLTVEDVRGIRVFAELEERDLERLSRSAADITLAAGEYAAHEGAERALFGLLEAASKPSSWWTRWSGWSGSGIPATCSARCR